MTSNNVPSSKPSKRPEPGRRHTGSKLKFKHASSNLSSFAFAQDQTWVNRSGGDAILFVDQAEASSEEVRRRAHSRKRPRANSQPSTSHSPSLNKVTRTNPAYQLESEATSFSFLPSTSHTSYDAEPRPASTRSDSLQIFKIQTLRDSSIQSARRTPHQQDAWSISSPVESYHLSSVGRSFKSPTSLEQHTPGPAWVPSGMNATRSEQASPLTPSVPQTLYQWSSQFSPHESACLVRVNIEVLCHWADAGSSVRHFYENMHQLARTFPPLLNAILLAGATHLLSTPAYKTPEGVIQYQGIMMPNITREAVIRCFDTCVADLLSYCNQSTGEYDDQILATLTILRYHEELLSFTDHGHDWGNLLRIFNSFSTARNLFDTPCSQDDVQATSKDARLAHFRSRRYAILRLALRQELTSAYNAQVPVQMNLEPWLPLDLIQEEDVDDSIWADKCLLQSVKVANLCYKTTRGSTNEEWAELKRSEKHLENTQPESFAPILWQDDDSKAFPLVWYASVTPIVGIQWLGLSKLLLMLYNPNLPRVGPGVLQAQERLADEVRSIVRTICGIADSNPTIQPAYVHAQMAIVAGSAYFTNPHEQDAMLAILAHLEYEFGWPTSSNVVRLRSMWHRGT